MRFVYQIDGAEKVTTVSRDMEADEKAGSERWWVEIDGQIQPGRFASWDAARDQGWNMLRQAQGTDPHAGAEDNDTRT